MPAKRYIVTLTSDEAGAGLEAMTRAWKCSARTITRACALLLTDQGEGGPAWEDARVAQCSGAGTGPSITAQQEIASLHGSALAHVPEHRPTVPSECR